MGIIISIIVVALVIYRVFEQLLKWYHDIKINRVINKTFSSYVNLNINVDKTPGGFRIISPDVDIFIEYTDYFDKSDYYVPPTEEYKYGFLFSFKYKNLLLTDEQLKQEVIQRNEFSRSFNNSDVIDQWRFESGKDGENNYLKANIFCGYSDGLIQQFYEKGYYQFMNELIELAEKSLVDEFGSLYSQHIENQIVNS